MPERWNKIVNGPTVVSIPGILVRAEAVAHFRLTIGHDFLGEYIHWPWLPMMSSHSAAMPEWMATYCSNALDSMNTRLTTSSVGTAKLGVKWSRRQAWALDK
ncbi:hypothetical protein TNCV_780781 [Trichonephila clavipes]|nr:hypothetical protein TNCV_780781 [Trichonephila clavipes]